MIDDERHPEMIRAQQDLTRQLGHVLDRGNTALTTSFLDKLFGVLRDHRAQWRMRGVDFPVMVALAVPRLGIIEFKRADLDILSIRVSIVNFVRIHPKVTMDEVVTAFRVAYPGLTPDDVLTGHSAALAADIRQAERQKRIQAEANEILGIDENKKDEKDG